MTRSTRLKPNFEWVAGLVLGAAALAASGWVLSRGALDESTFRLLIALAMTWATLQQSIFLVGIRNPRYVIPLLTTLTLAVAGYADWFGFDTIRNVSAALFLPLLIAALITAAAHPLKFRSRRILELAARPVSGTGDGFTPRPFPAGEIDASREEILRFARYMKRKLIAFSFIDRKRALLAISDNDWKFVFNLRPDLYKTTYAEFRFDGRFSVHIAEKDYRKYKEELTFDELCSSLGGVFERFLDYHRRGTPDHIIRELTSGKERADEPENE